MKTEVSGRWRYEWKGYYCRLSESLKNLTESFFFEISLKMVKLQMSITVEILFGKILIYS